MFEKRSEGIGPIYVGSYKFGDRIEPWEIEPGHQVALKLSGITVIADVIANSSNGMRAKVIGFENYLEEQLEGISAGDDVDFKLEHVFSCSR